MSESSAKKFGENCWVVADIAEGMGTRMGREKKPHLVRNTMEHVSLFLLEGVGGKGLTDWEMKIHANNPKRMLQLETRASVQAEN